MLNLFMYRPDALYPTDFTDKPEKKGATAYNKYSRPVLRVVSKLGDTFYKQVK